MSATNKLSGLDGLPDFLRISVEKGLFDEAVASRVELYRRTSGLGEYGDGYPLLNAAPDATMTFPNFVRLRGNAFALELAQSVAAKAPVHASYNPLYIYGEVGLGKTHLLSAIANEAADRRVLMINTVDLEAEFVRAKRTDFQAELREWLVSMEILLLDDIQLCEGNEELQMELFSILNHMTRSGRRVVFSSDAYPTQLVGVELRLLSRLRGGVIVGLQMADWAERVGILRHFLGEINLRDDALEYLAKHIGDNVRQLKAAVCQLLAMSGTADSEINMDMVRTLVSQLDPWKSVSSELGEHANASPNPSDRDENDIHSAARRFKEMVASSDTAEEQSLALQIAIGERIRQLHKDAADGESVSRLELALQMLRDGDMEGAIKCLMA